MNAKLASGGLLAQAEGLDAELMKLLGDRQQILKKVANNKVPAATREGLTDEAKGTTGGHADEATHTEMEQNTVAIIKVISRFREEIIKIVYYVHYWLSRPERPAIFVDKKGNSISAPKNSSDPNLADLLETLQSIASVGISNADAEKEINRLLDHTSAKRISEEMDVVTYHANATRLFDRVKTEFKDIATQVAIDLSVATGEHKRKRVSAKGRVRSHNPRTPIASTVGINVKSSIDIESDIRMQLANATLDAIKEAETVVEDISDQLSANELLRDVVAAIDAYQTMVKKWEGKANLSGTQPGNNIVAANNEFDVGLRYLHMVSTTISRYKTFLQSAMSGAGRIIDDFCSEAAVELFKDATRPIAKNIEREGLIPGMLPVLMAVMVALLVIVVLVFLDNSLVTKNVVWYTVTVFAAVTLICSTVFVRVTRSRILGDLRATLYQRAIEMAALFPTTTVATRFWQRVSKERRGSDDYFKFQKAEWHRIEAKNKGPTSTSLVGSLGRLIDRGWRWHKRRLLAWNIGLLILFGGGLVALSWLSGALDSRRTYEFVSRTGVGEPCVLETGKLLMAMNDSYFVVAKNGNITEIPKASILRIRIPGTLSVGNTVACDEPERLVADTFPSAEVSSPIVVPILVQQLPSNGNPITPEINNTFVSKVFSGAGVVHDLATGIMVFPLFTNPVLGQRDNVLAAGGGRIDDKEKAFFFGARSLNDPKLPMGGNATLLQIIGQSFSECMDKANAAHEAGLRAGAPPPLRLVVEGYASQKWDSLNPSDIRRELLNWYLAEGRRNAVIRALNIDHASIEIENEPERLSFSNLSDVRSANVEADFQFQTPEAMMASLSGWLKAELASSDAEKSLSELFARSAILRVKEPIAEECRSVLRST